MKSDRQWLWVKAVWVGRAGLAAAVFATCLQPARAQEGTGTKSRIEKPSIETAAEPSVSADRALEIAEGFVGRMWPRRGRGLSHEAPQLASGSDGSREWSCVFRSEEGGWIRVTLDAGTGRVRYAANREASAREGDEVKLTPEQALSRAGSFLESMGVDRRQIALLNLRLDWDTGRACQVWRATWERVVNGIRIGHRLFMSLDAQSGELIEVDMGRGPTGPLDIRVDRYTAVKRALEVAARVLETAPVELDYDWPPELAVVPASGSLTTDDGGAARAPQPRMAWVAQVSTRSTQPNKGVELWIDARSGELIEGVGDLVEGSRDRPRQSASEEVPRAPVTRTRRETESSRPKGAVTLLVLSIAGMAAVVIIALIVSRPRGSSAPPQGG